MSRAFATYWALTGVFLLAVGIHVGLLGGGLHSLALRDEYAYEQVVEITGALGDVRLAMFVPAPSPGLEIRDETFETADLDLEVQEEGGDRLLVLRGRTGSAGRQIRYSARLATVAAEFHLDPDLPWPVPAAGDSLWLAATPTIQADHPEIAALLVRLFGLQAADDAAAWPAARWQELLAARGIGPAAALAAVYREAAAGIRPASFSGTTDALTALRLGEASCGGKSRLMVAACRRLGIPARIVGGAILGQPGRRRAHHLWVEARLGGAWVPCDPLNGYFATRPARFATLYRGDQALIRHSRGLTFDYGFASVRQRVPLVWLKPPHEAGGADPAAAAGRTHLIPLLERRNFSAILLAPLALLLIVFARQVVGFESIGTFLPILLGFSLIQADWVVTGLQMAMAVLLGVVMRFLLGRLNLLHVPRTAVMITFVVMVYLAFSAGVSRLDSFAGVGAVILPLAALAMAVEKFTLVAMDKGSRSALWLLLQTVVLALGCRLIMVTPFFQNLVIAFPEVLVQVTAMIILVGHYRGLRWKEAWRFRQIPARGTP